MAQDKGESVLAERLDGLFRSSRPRGRTWTNDEVATELKAVNPGLRVSGAYLSALRTGKRERPSRELLDALAAFFGVAPAYFYDRDHADQTSRQLAMLDELHQAGVRSIALRAVGLPPESLDAVTAVLDQIRKLQGLPPVDD
ncbi:helix-turn-helix domain-containing protein [Kutzneria sp. CA-103260]|uniref:helix-turn-helix domain-containing protein n=1 Tax=Kutzneria sp. CA-103260 TaxID=2802641 RepID=UPI001BAD9868|nr:helix-turn-helix transcriptional regulator [Kutzneria sp. CA-103260]QUQ66638.1 Nucleoid-associated protein EspR [Kutzneria sp. CA-103260]